MFNLWALFCLLKTNLEIKVFVYRGQPPSVNLLLLRSVYGLCVCMRPPSVSSGVYGKHLEYELSITQPPSVQVRVPDFVMSLKF